MFQGCQDYKKNIFKMAGMNFVTVGNRVSNDRGTQAKDCTGVVTSENQEY
jgi:hypothetical protein